MSLDDYKQLLSRHDWYYAYSDDHRVWKAGNESQQRIEALALLSPEHAQAYFAARNGPAIVSTGIVAYDRDTPQEVAGGV